MDVGHTQVLDEDADALEVMHELVPHSYLCNSWPLRLVRVSPEGLDIAVAGTQGFALYDRRSKKWRIFEDVGQERVFQVLQLGWLRDVVVVARRDGGGGGRPAGAAERCSLVLHSRFYLDQQEVLVRQPLPEVLPSPFRPSLLTLRCCAVVWASD